MSNKTIIEAFAAQMPLNVEDTLTLMNDGFLPLLTKSLVLAIDHDIYKVIEVMTRKEAAAKGYIPACYDDYGCLTEFGEWYEDENTYLVKTPTRNLPE